MNLRMFDELAKISYTYDERVDKNRNEALVASLMPQFVAVFVVDVLLTGLSGDAKYDIVKIAAHSFVYIYTFINCARGSLYNTWMDKLFIFITFFLGGFNAAFAFNKYIIPIPFRHESMLLTLFAILDYPLFIWLCYRLLLMLWRRAQKRLPQEDDEN